MNLRKLCYPVIRIISVGILIGRRHNPVGRVLLTDRRQPVWQSREDQEENG